MAISIMLTSSPIDPRSQGGMNEAESERKRIEREGKEEAES